VRRSAPEAPRQLLLDAQLVASSSTSSAARALALAEEVRDVAAATLGELGTQSDALRGVAATLSEAEAHVEASERTLDDINTGCFFGCFGPRKRLARRRWRASEDNKGAGGGAGGGGGAAVAYAPAPAAATAAARSGSGGGGGAEGGAARPRRASSAKAIAARAKLPSSALQSARGAGADAPGRGAAGSGSASASSSRHNNGPSSSSTALFEDAALSREAAAQDKTLQQIDAAVRGRCAARAPLALAHCDTSASGFCCVFSLRAAPLPPRR
jgi:hypothetical protein